MTQQFKSKSNDGKPLYDCLRGPRTNPNSMFPYGNKATGMFNRKFFCEQAKQHLAKRGGGSGSSNPTSHSGMISSITKGNSSLSVGKSLTTKEDISTNLSPAQSKEIQKFSGNPLSLCYDSRLFNSSVPSKSTTCHQCGLYGSLRCSQCKQTYYCSAACQREDWSAHNIVCKPVNKQNFHKPEDVSNLPAEIKTMEMKREANFPLETTTKVVGLGKKIMFSDLPNLGLRKTMEIQGTVTEFKHPGEFYLQIYSSAVVEYIGKLSVSLRETYTNTAIQEEYIPIKGEVCVAKYFVDQTWNRIIVQDVDVPQGKAQVLYIDFGNSEVIPFSRLQQLKTNIELFPPCAIKCCVANVIPAAGGWTNDCISTVKPLIGEQYCSGKILDILQEEMISFAVDIVLPVSGKHLDCVLVELGHGLRLKEQIIKSENSNESYFEAIRNKSGEEEKSIEQRNNLKMLSLNIGEEFSAAVAHISSPDVFFCQYLKNGKDNQWYRASLLAYISEDSAVVGYVDYGNFEIVNLSRLRPMSPHLLKLPVQSIRCSLAGVKSPSQTWTLEAISVMKKLVQNKMITVKVVDKKDNSSLVELMNTSVNPSISINKCLIDAGIAVEDGNLLTTDKAVNVKDVSAMLTVEESLNKTEWTKVELAVNQVVDVLVCMVYNPGEFYCQILKEDAMYRLNELNKSLAKHCQQSSPYFLKPTVGEPCCAFFLGDYNWYRALVKEILPNGYIKVHFVDYGNVEEVKLDKLRQISAEFLRLPFQGIQCWLSDVKPIRKEWTKEATERFRMCVAGIKLQARVLDIRDRGAGLQLTDLSTDHPKIINDILISENLALREGPPSRGNCNNNPIRKMNSHIDSKIQATSSPHLWKTIEFPVNSSVPVHIVEVINPNLFYAFPINNKVDQGKLQRMTMELLEHCNSQKNRTSFTPRIGGACCARFLCDNYWYRAIVLDIFNSEVKVVYVDYGNIETLPFSRVLPISASLLELPFQIIRCSFEGIMQLPALLVKDQLKKLMLNQRVLITIKGIHENVHAVSVLRQSENGTLNIADILVLEGLAKPIKNHNQGVFDKEESHQINCCCLELQKKVEKHEQILLFLLNKSVDQDKFTEMKRWFNM
ncbi:tudor domain-containing protein 1 isoform X2 [Tachyglossus aculeatus]|uniref:tudor domain-containing protein 1 isoform X2 n=1 Tax=Tachyglossus aculeatus TaxID=9261 RepID=UPI0018F29B9C|nr:tudor domain-containing protein 1 isoform X2 [Tachyglossus aculeatus]